MCYTKLTHKITPTINKGLALTTKLGVGEAEA